MKENLKVLIEFYYKKLFTNSLLVVFIFIILGNIAGIYIEKYNLAKSLIDLSLSLFILPSFILFGYKIYVKNEKAAMEFRDSEDYTRGTGKDYIADRRMTTMVNLEFFGCILIVVEIIYLFIVFLKACSSFIAITS